MGDSLGTIVAIAIAAILGILKEFFIEWSNSEQFKRIMIVYSF